MEQKRENLFNLALETPEQERERTGNLNVGFDPAVRSWEMIVKFHGNLQAAVEQLEASLTEEESARIKVEVLIAGYAILTVPEVLVDTVTALEEIEYAEMPKRFYYSAVPGFDPADSACFAAVAQGPPFLTGRGVLLLIADSGIDWQREDFIRADGSTRIRWLWDQVLGQEFDTEQINTALMAQSAEMRFQLLPSIDVTGHGTAVAGIAAGASRSSGYAGAAPWAELLVVKLGPADPFGFPRTTELMRAIAWGLRKAEVLQMPLVINLSFGNSYGAHDGSSLLERFLDNAAEIGRTVICVGSGNEGANGGHAAGRVTSQKARQEIAVANYERNLRLQLWQNFSDRFRIYLISPGGRRVEMTAPVNGGKYTVWLENTKILAYQGEPSPYAVAKELYLEFLPEGTPYITSGIWTLELEPEDVVTGQYYLYLSDGATRSSGTFFFTPTPQVTLTIPSTAAKVITVGAYDNGYDAYADFSGRGYADEERTIGVITAGLAKPDIVAPGINILAPDLFGGYSPMTGTSFATPIVSGAAALLMEWGIVRGNDPFLYGEKVKAYLRRGARPLRGIQNYPDDRVGWGKLCVADSLQTT